MTDQVSKDVQAAERQRCAAMLANDRQALEAILDPALHFAHATGAVDGKEAYLAKMSGGRIRYVDIAWSEERVTPLGDVSAMITGRMATDVEVDGVAKQLRNRVIAVWVRSGDRWQLLAFQSTPLKD